MHDVLKFYFLLITERIQLLPPKIFFISLFPLTANGFSDRKQMECVQVYEQKHLEGTMQKRNVVWSGVNFQTDI